MGIVILYMIGFAMMLMNAVFVILNENVSETLGWVCSAILILGKAVDKIRELINN